MRAARIYDPDSADHLYVNLNVLGGTAAPYSFRIELKKWLYDLRDPSAGDGGGMGFAGTWRSSEVGYGDASYILAAVGRHMDEFIDEYLRVNECDGTGEASP
ncbi:hypothetical protein [Candidatus Palauibacter sp.]|uniref:hypothetical protein n=1 Tax=Candidatus Palauibacter sp. TaxID=3101350 RepID=UPI003B520031